MVDIDLSISRRVIHSKVLGGGLEEALCVNSYELMASLMWPYQSF